MALEIDTAFHVFSPKFNFSCIAKLRLLFTRHQSPAQSYAMAHPQTDSEKEPISSSEPVSDIESTLPRDATDEEVHTLLKVVDRIPIAAWAAALVGAAERFSYYSTISIWREMASQANIVEKYY